MKICDLIHAKGSEVQGTYQKDFYKDYPAVTKNTYGKGNAYYVAFRNDDNFTDDFCSDLIDKYGIKADTEIKAEDGVTIRKRGDTIFVMNFADTEKTITLDKEYTNIVDGVSVNGEITLPVCGYIILE